MGISIAQSELIARMDADDVSFPERLNKQYDFLKINKRYIVVGSNAEIIDLNGDYVFISTQPETDDKAKKYLPASPFIHPSVMFRKKEYIKAGKYCEGLVKSQDTVLFNRMSKYGKFYNIKEPLIKYRVVPTSNSLRRRIGNKYKKIIETAIMNNKISNEDKNYIISLIKRRNSNIRIFYYHLFLAKKYLWSNYNPIMARKNLNSALRYKKNIVSIILYLISFLPKKTIKIWYDQIKGKN